jgi:ecotin
MLTLPVSLSAQGEDIDLKPWPAAGEGQTRLVIRLPFQENEDRLKVEILVGKTLTLDSVNHYHFGGSLKQETIQGWGYPLWEVEVGEEIAGTLMAVPEGAPRIPRHVPVLFDNGLIRYNSKLPVVVYVPKGFETRYRIWSAGEPLAASSE